jgi:hypothetical protein
MALYEDDTMQLREQGAPPPDPSIYELKGTMGPVGQEQEYYERRKSPTVGQEQPQGMPAGGDINQFLDWAVKTQLGYNPYTMNPVTEAMKKWNTLESQAFQEVFGNSGITPNNMTPEALKHWNEQRKAGIKTLIDEATAKQSTGMEYIKMLKEGWKNWQEVTALTTINPATGKEEYVTKAGRPTGVVKPSGSDRGQYVGTTLDENGNPAAVVFNPKSQSFTTQPFPEGKAPMPRQIAESVKSEIGAVSQTQDLVDGLERQWSDMGIVSREDAIKAYTKGKIGDNPTAKAYSDLREAFLGQLSRSIAAERGVLTNQDIDRIKKALPAIGINPLGVDNAEEASKKWKEIYTIIENAKRRTWEKAGMTYSTVKEKRSSQAEKYFKDEKEEKKTEKPKTEKKVVGRRKSPSGKIIVKYDDGTFGEE